MFRDIHFELFTYTHTHKYSYHHCILHTVNFLYTTTPYTLHIPCHKLTYSERFVSYRIHHTACSTCQTLYTIHVRENLISYVWNMTYISFSVIELCCMRKTSEVTYGVWSNVWLVYNIWCTRFLIYIYM